MGETARVAAKAIAANKAEIREIMESTPTQKRSGTQVRENGMGPCHIPVFGN
jgi:hypothetical protein